MNRLKFFLSLYLLFIPVLTIVGQNEEVIQGLVIRLIPEYQNQFVFKQKDSDKDFFTLEMLDDKVKITGNDANSMAVGLNHYLKYFCKTTVSWYAADEVEMPAQLPQINKPLTVKARCENRFFLNYCTFGYTMPWWKWADWERLIDWMALNGVNMPLAITGQEYNWYQVWKKLGMSDQQIRDYFTGPAHLPWHRMANVDHWQGGLPMEWLEGQRDLQIQILKREREFNMTPVLPAFSGHVPGELRELYPNSKITKMSNWGGFADQYSSAFLDPLDELFPKIQKMFLEEQTKTFGTNHIYGADPFNELTPPSWEPDFLATCSRQIYKSITDVDKEGTWLQMTWLFFHQRKNWTNERIKSFLTAVPQDKMLLLDYYGDNQEIWKLTDKFYGQPYFWCFLGNFGGNTLLNLNLKLVDERITNVFKNGGDNLYGLGSTLEGFDVSPFAHEYVFEQAWNLDRSLDEWIDVMADSHLGHTDKNFRKAWHLLNDSIFKGHASAGKATLTNARPLFEGVGKFPVNSHFNYSNKELLKVWSLMLKVGEKGNSAYQLDLVNIGRQVLANHFMVFRDKFTEAYKKKSVSEMQLAGNQMKELLVDLDQLLGTQESLLLGKWISDARSMGKDEASRDYYEENARNLITTWGNKGLRLTDYGNRNWAGLTIGYYFPRWSLFIDSAINAVKDGKAFDEEKFKKEVVDIEWGFVTANTYYTPYPVGSSYHKSLELFNKYVPLINLK